MQDLNNISNNEILLYIKQLELDYDALKLKIGNDYDKLEEMEVTYQKAHNIIRKRLNGE